MLTELITTGLPSCGATAIQNSSCTRIYLYSFRPWGLWATERRDPSFHVEIWRSSWRSHPLLFILTFYDGQPRAYTVRGSGPNLTEVSDVDISIRLSQAINSFVLLDQLDISLYAQNWPEVDPSDVGLSGGSLQFAYKEVPALTTDAIFVYRIAWPWMVACIISCGVLSALGVLSVVFAHMARGPELLGFVSTILRDSRYVSISSQPAELEKMTGFELSRLIRNERIRYGQIRTSDAERSWLSGAMRMLLRLRMIIMPSLQEPHLGQRISAW